MVGTVHNMNFGLLSDRAVKATAADRNFRAISNVVSLRRMLSRTSLKPYAVSGPGFPAINDYEVKGCEVRFLKCCVELGILDVK